MVIAISNGLSQNPLDIKSRISEEGAIIPSTITSNSSEDSLGIAQRSSTENANNPFDIKKEPNRQINKPKESKEDKRYVNEPETKLGKLPKVVILLGMIGFFVLIRGINQKGISQITRSFTSQVRLVEHKLSFNGLLNTQLGLFYVFFFINAAYFFYLCLENNLWGLTEKLPVSFWLILGLIIGIYVIKYFALSVIEYGLNIRKAISNHLFSVSIHNIMLGFGLFFINAFLAFSSNGLSNFLMILGIIVIVVFYLLRQVKGLAFVSDLRHFSLLHFFIYLCSCEISPLLIAAKIITG